MTQHTHSDDRCTADTATTASALGRDDRGVSALLGGILLFALVIALVALLQVSAVPASNAQVEFEHNQRVQGDMQELLESQSRVTSVGSEAAVRVETGTGYPQRFLLLNPPRPSGSLRTGGDSQFVVDNVQATGETGDYWDGTARQFTTTTLTYQPNYNEYASAPRTVLEHGTLYNQHGNGETTIVERGALINGQRISLVSLQGSLSTTSDRSTAVGLTPISAPAQRITVTDDGSPITLTVPTNRSAAAWTGMLEDELAENGGHVVSVTPGATPDTVTITLEQGVSYSMRTAAVGIGTGYASQPGPTYVVDVSGNGSVVPEGGTQRLTVQVRDAYNNPVNNESVSFSADSGTVEPVGSGQTDANGQVTVEYTAPANVDALVSDSVTATIEPNENERQRVRFRLSVFDADSSGSSDSASGGNPINPGNSIILTDADLVPTTSNCQNRENGCEVRLTFRNLASSTPTIEQMRLSFYATSDSYTPPATVDVSDEEGGAVTTLGVGDDFSADGELALDGFGVAGSSGGEQQYRFAFKGFQRTSGNSQVVNDGARGGDFFVIEVVFEDSSGRRAAVTYFAPPS